MLEIILTSLIIALFCSGLGILTEYNPDAPKRHQMLLYWLKKPLVDEQIKEENYHNSIINNNNKAWDNAIMDLLSKPKIDKLMVDSYQDSKEEMIKRVEKVREEKLNYQFYLKPFILCVYCFPSFWGSIIFFTLNYTFNLFHVDLMLIPIWLITIIIALPINAIIYGVYEKLTK